MSRRLCNINEQYYINQKKKKEVKNMVNKKQKVFARVLCSILSVLIILGSFSLSAFAAVVFQ